MAPVRGRLHRTPEWLEAVRVSGDRLVRAHGTRCAVVETGCLDIDAIDPARRAAAVAAHARLCRLIEWPMQIIV